MDESELTESLVNVAEALSEIQLLTDSEDVINAAKQVGQNHSNAAQSGANAIDKGEDADTSTGYQVSSQALEGARSKFLDAAKEELGVKPYSGDPSSSTDGEATEAQDGPEDLSEGYGPEDLPKGSEAPVESEERGAGRRLLGWFGF